MEIKMKKSQVMNCGKKVFSIGYCSLSSLLHCTNRVGYTTGVYGWNADIYEFDNAIIVTGYRPFGEGVNGKLVAEYEEKAREIVLANRFDDFELLKKKLDVLIKEFLSKIME